jgi:hypothetical protein
MTPGCDREALDALVLGRLGAEGEAEVIAHARGCAACSEELAWLRTERALFTERREAALPPEIWQAVERRISERPRPSRRATVAAVALALGAAAALAIAVHPWTEAPRPTALAVARPDPGRVLDAAEQEYRQAIAVLEGELAGSAVAPRWRDDLAIARSGVADARTAAGRDPEQRLRVLEGYATYLRSLQTVALAIEERR